VVSDGDQADESNSGAGEEVGDGLGAGAVVAVPETTAERDAVALAYGGHVEDLVEEGQTPRAALIEPLPDSPSASLKEPKTICPEPSAPQMEWLST
jgi:hypothetical protein